MALRLSEILNPLAGFFDLPSEAQTPQSMSSQCTQVLNKPYCYKIHMHLDIHVKHTFLDIPIS